MWGYENPPYYLTAYGLAVKHGFRGTEKEWLDSLTAYGVAVSNGYKGTIDDWLLDLTAYGQAVQQGFEGTKEEWIQSLSAYGQAVAEGFKGTRQEWLASLIGATYTPVLTENGTLSWTNDRGLPNPDPVNLPELIRRLPGGIRKRIAFSIPVKAWMEDTNADDKFRFYYQLQDEDITSKLIPNVVLAKESLATASACGMCATAESYDGYVQLYCAKRPDAEIYAACNLMNVGSYGTNTEDPDNIPDSEGIEVADDEEVTGMLNEIFGVNAVNLN